MPIVVEYIFYLICLLIINAIFGLPMLIIASVILIIYNIRYHTTYLLNFIKVLLIVNEMKTNTIQDKLKITPEEVEKERKEYDEKAKNTLTEKQYKELNKVIRQVMG